MSFSTTVVVSIAIILASITVTALLLWQAGENRSKVPVKRILGFAALLASLIFVGSWGASNLAAVAKTNEARAINTFIMIEVQATLNEPSVDENPLMDMSAGQNDFRDAATIKKLNSGEAVDLNTMTGKQASVKIVTDDEDSSKFTAIFTYDNKELMQIPNLDGATHSNTGFPQIIQAPKIGGDSK